MNIRDMTKISFFTAVTVICAQISVSIGTVPFTMHTFAFFLSASVLGFKKGILSVLIYILLGILGLPVFSGFKGGIDVLFGPTGGYIWGFLFSAAVIGFITEHFNKSTVASVFSMIFGLMICYIVGSIQYMLLYTKNFSGFKIAVATCVLPFIPFDTVKIILAAAVSRKIKNITELKRSF